MTAARSEGILMQENRPFDHHFGTLQGVRGFNDPRVANIHLPLKSGNGSKQVQTGRWRRLLRFRGSKYLPERG